MLSVGDWKLPVLGYKAGDPAAENDTPDWVTGVVAEEGSKLGGGKMVDISPNSEYYVSRSGFSWTTYHGWSNMYAYRLYVSGGANTSITGYIELNLQSLLSSLSNPVLLIYDEGELAVYNEPAAGEQSRSDIYRELRTPGGTVIVYALPYELRQYNEDPQIRLEFRWRSPWGGSNLDIFKTENLRIWYYLHAINTPSSVWLQTYVMPYIALFEKEGV